MPDWHMYRADSQNLLRCQHDINMEREISHVVKSEQHKPSWNFENPPYVCQSGMGWICISLSFQAEISFNLSQYPIVSVSSMLVGGTNIVYLCAGHSLCHVIMSIMCSRELLSCDTSWQRPSPFLFSSVELRNALDCVLLASPVTLVYPSASERVAGAHLWWMNACIAG